MEALGKKSYKNLHQEQMVGEEGLRETGQKENAKGRGDRRL